MSDLGVIARKPPDSDGSTPEVAVGDNTPGQDGAAAYFGELIEHVDSVVTPLLVPDTPVVIWWPGSHPRHRAPMP